MVFTGDETRTQIFLNSIWIFLKAIRLSYCETIDEPWIHYYTLESESAVQTIVLNGWNCSEKVMVTLFLDVHGGHNFHIWPIKCTFYQDNAHAHTSFVVPTELHHSAILIASRAPYSSDLAPRDYLLFLNRKKWLAGELAETVFILNV